MGIPVIIVASKGLAVTESLFGVPMTVAANGYGIPVTFVVAGLGGLAVAGISAGPVTITGTFAATDIKDVAAFFGEALTAPVLAMNPAWTTADNEPDFTIDVDDTVNTGDDVRLQVQVAGGDWSSPVSDTTHEITAPEDAANEVSLSNGSLSNGNYEARCNVTHGSTSNWSNTVSFTVAVVASVPVNSVAPAITGNTQVGQTLTTTDGTWSNTPTGYTYQWKRAGSNITSATASTYVLVELDAGVAITCVVTASNAAGAGSPATSNALTTDVYLVYLTHIEDTSNTSTYSGAVWQGITLGTAAANRKIVITAATRGSIAGVFGSGAVAGQALSQQIAATSDTNNNIATVLIADVPTGTSGNISVIFTQSKDRCGAGVWALYGAASSTASDTDKTEAAADGNVTLTVPAKGVAVGVSYHQTAGTATWTGLTERYDLAIESTICHTGAGLNSNAGGNINIISDWSAADTNGVHAFASWGP